MVLNFAQQVALDFSGSVATYGRPVQVKHYVPSYPGTTTYDNNYLTKSGTTQYIHAMDFPVGMGRNGGEDFKMLEQGQIRHDDRKWYFNPTPNFSGAFVKLAVSGTTITEYYSVLPEGANVYKIQGVDIYKKVYTRILNTGSFQGEI